jgi:hypothetical protein
MIRNREKKRIGGKILKAGLRMLKEGNALKQKGKWNIIVID